jgi:hypothetical protein
MVRKLIAWSEIVGGTLGLLLLAYLTFKTAVLPTAAVILPGLSGFLFTIAAGVLLARNTARGRLLSMAVQAVQIPLVSTAAFAFRFQAGPQALVGESASYIGFRTDYTLQFPPVSEPHGLVVNLAAVFALMWLAVEGVRQRKGARPSPIQAAA